MKKEYTKPCVKIIIIDTVDLLADSMPVDNDPYNGIYGD